MPTGIYERPWRGCSVHGCDRKHKSLGYCNAHYLRNKRGESLDILPRVIGDLETRFWRKVSGGNVETCWLWTGSIKGTGYGQIMIDGRPARAHRVAYELLRAEIPSGLVLDHLCGIKACVNPWHLEPVTQAINVQRALERVS
jgi:hypothetical protein